MTTKIKRNGQSTCTIQNDKLKEFHATGGRQGHRARMELIKRGLLNGQGKNLFELVADSELSEAEMSEAS